MCMKLTNRVYFARRESTGEIIGIRHGETGFYETTVYDQAHANVLNERQGIEPHEVEAAVACSVMDSWSNFAGIAATFKHGVAA